MELYIAVPKAITDIYWNGVPEESEALGMFCVKPEVKKGKFGGKKVIGFKEAITGEKVAERIYYGTEYTIEHVDLDSTIGNNNIQIGDIIWEIADEHTADKVLSPEELQKYMSLSAEEVREQLQSIRAKARSIAQECRNLEVESRLRKAHLNSNNTYIAIPKAITHIYNNGIPEKSEALGMFCVNPEVKKVMFGRTKVTGFKEVITGEKVANRIYYGTEYSVEYVDLDSAIEKNAQIGDIIWDIVDKSTADRLIPPEELQKYMSLSAEEVREQLQSIYEKAKSIAQSSEKTSGKKL